MPTFKPTRELVIAQPCTESWDSMSGGSRERHCSACDRNVLNVAVLTPAQLEAVLATPGPLPCMRLVQFEDGSVLTAQEEQARGRVSRVAAAAMGTLLTIAAAAQQVTPKAKASLAGLVVGSDGKPVSSALVHLNGPGGHRYLVQTGADGRFVAGVEQTGLYNLSVEAAGISTDEEDVRLHVGGQELKKPLKMKEATITVGEVIEVKHPTASTRKVELNATVAPEEPKVRVTPGRVTMGAPMPMSAKAQGR